MMRTTIPRDERLLAQVERRAAESGTSLSTLVEQSVRLFVRREPPRRGGLAESAATRAIMVGR